MARPGQNSLAGRATLPWNNGLTIMKRSPLFCLLVLAAASFSPAPAAAQTPVPPTTPSAPPSSPAERRFDRYWKAEVPGGVYLIDLNAITSASVHTYSVDNTVQVTELCITNTGGSVARFYFIERLLNVPTGLGQMAVDRAAEALNTVADRTGNSQVLGMVTKNYPATTHARTVEYRLKSKEDVLKLYESVESAWTNRKGVRIKLE
jgi:hypothetical protein